MRQIVLDTETTGLDPNQAHRVIEVGCVELIDRRVSGNNFHHYINPERDIDEAASEVHGLTAEKLKDKPLFREIAKELLEFIKGGELIIHNAPFDVGFLNHEFALAGYEREVIEGHCSVVDTLLMARHMHPGQRNTLDALCKRYSVDNTERTLHGALLDAEILADVYLAMTGGQTTLLGGSLEGTGAQAAAMPSKDIKGITTAVIVADAKDLGEHEKWLQLLDEKSESGAIWRTHMESK